MHLCLTVYLRFLTVCSAHLPKERQRKEFAKVLQALRIEVNDELQALEEFMQSAISMLAPGGRLVVLTYHSLEDRIVKNFMKAGNLEGKQEKDFYGNVVCDTRTVSPFPAVPTQEEIESNPRARSAKLRVCEKKVRL